MSAFERIPRTALFGAVSHLKKVVREQSEAMTEFVAATDARMRLGSGDDRTAANARVIKAYDRVCVLVHGTEMPRGSGKLKKLSLHTQQLHFHGLLSSNSGQQG